MCKKTNQPNKQNTPTKQKPLNTALITQFAVQICAQKCIILVNTIFLLGGKYKADLGNLHNSGSYNI